MTVSRTKGVDAVIAGHLCLDMFPSFAETSAASITDIFQPGKLVKMEEMTFAAAGAVANTGQALRRFGCSVAFVARVGDDVIGAIILDMFRKQGNIEGISVTPGDTSSYTVALSPPGIDRILLHYPGSNDVFTSRDVDFSLVETARLFHFGYPAHMAAMREDGGKELRALFTEAKRLGATTTMDNSLPDPSTPAGKADWRPIYEHALPAVDVFCPSIEEAFLTLDRKAYVAAKRAHGGDELIDHLSYGEYRTIASTFIDMGCAVAGLKAGHRGWYLRTASSARLRNMGRAAPADVKSWADRELWCPAFRVDRIAGATGSGDASIAGFLAALLAGYTPESCLKMANCAGATNLRRVDAVSGLASWDEMQQLATQMPMQDVPLLHDSDWSWDDSAGLWVH